MRTKLCDTSLLSHENIVQSGLALTPSDIYKMSLDGTPISTLNSSLQYEEGKSELDFTPDLEHQRGVDINDLWDARQSFNARVRKAKKDGLFTTVTDSTDSSI